MLNLKSKKAAMELSMSTIVILVLAMSMLILGLVLVKQIFGVAGGAIENVDQGVKDQIAKMFSDESKRIVVYPSSRQISLTQGTQGWGFAFSARNLEMDSKKFTYLVELDPEFNVRLCGSTITKKTVDKWITIPTGSFTLGGSSVLENPKKVLFNVPLTAPACTMPFNVIIKCTDCDSKDYTSDTVYITIKAK